MTLASGHIKTGSGFTQGGYCRSMTVHRFFLISNFNFNLNITFRRYLVKVPEGYPLEKAGPIFCAGKNILCHIQQGIFNWKCDHGTAGITMYSPLSHWNCLGGGKRVGIVGIGGLGQMGVQFAKIAWDEIAKDRILPGEAFTRFSQVRLAKAMGNTVTAISTSPHKETVARWSLSILEITISCWIYLRISGVSMEMGVWWCPYGVHKVSVFCL